MEGYRSSTATMAFWLIMISACFLAIDSAYVANKKTKLMLNIVSINNCSEDEQLPIYARNIIVSRPNREIMVVNGEIVATANPSNLKFEAVIYKCGNRMGTDCEQFMRVPFDDGCFILTAKNQFWSPILDSIHPRMKCPGFETGIYTLTNGSFDVGKLMDMASSIPDVTVHYWRHRLRLFTNKRDLFCITYVGNMKQIKN